MSKILAIIASFLLFAGFAEPDANLILDRVDKNMSSKNRIFKSEMIIQSRRSTRTLTMLSYTEGSNQSYTEYLSPAREKGTKMLKKSNQLWIYMPSEDRIIQITGQMLRQSVMGSDLSYEDLMEDRKLKDMYNARVAGNDTVGSRNTYVLVLTARVEDVAYQTQKIWVDMERSVPLKQEMFAKSGQILKRTLLSEVTQIQGKWFPMRILYKDMLKEGIGTEFRFTSIKFDQEIPEYIFSKAALKQ